MPTVSAPKVSAETGAALNTDNNISNVPGPFIYRIFMIILYINKIWVPEKIAKTVTINSKLESAQNFPDQKSVRITPPP